MIISRDHDRQALAAAREEAHALRLELAAAEEETANLDEMAARALKALRERAEAAEARLSEALAALRGLLIALEPWKMTANVNTAKAAARAVLDKGGGEP